MNAYDLTVTFDSDWAIGSGSARHASIDRLVRRDTDGLPFLPGKTLRGMLREANGCAARALDDGVSGPGAAWTQLHRHLFGSAGRDGILSVPSAHLPPAARRALTADPALAAATTLVRASTALDESGRARHGSLRLEERARQGASLSCALSVDAPDGWLHEQGWAIDLLLHATARLVTRIGGKRRRGAGRCTVVIDTAAPALDIASVAAYRFSAPHTDRPHMATTTETSASAEDTGTTDWRRYWVTVTTRDPVMINDRTLGNTASGRAYIPGTMLLALLTQRLGNPVRSAVQAGKLIVTDATPFGSDGTRGLATPRSLTVPKVAAEKQITVIDSLRDDPPAGIHYVPVAGYLDTSDTVSVLTQLPGTIAQTHVDVTGGNGPFTFDALQPGACVRAELWTRRPLAVSALAGPARLGGSRRTEYGGVDIDVVADATHKDPARDVPAGQTLTVWFTSDLLLPLADPTTETIRQALQDALGTELTVRGAALSFLRRDPWHAGWGLAQPSHAIAAAGSVLAVTVASAVTGPKLDAIEHHGLGVRTAEGYGRLLFNPAILTSATSQPLLYTEATRPSLSTSATTEKPDDEFVAAVRAAAARRAIDEACTVLAADDTTRATIVPSWPGDSPAGDLRRVLQQLTTADGHRAAITWIDRIGESRSRTQRWRDWDHLSRWLTDPATFVAAGSPGYAAYTRIRELLDQDRPDESWQLRILQRSVLAALAVTRAQRVSNASDQTEVDA